jgi:hypothetical protein
MNGKLVRECLSEPIPEIFTAAEKLSAAVIAHASGRFTEAARLLEAANDPVVWNYTDAAWGAGAKARYGFVHVPSAPPALRLQDRPVPRMPTAATRRLVVQRDGYHCRFCGMPVIDAAIRRLIKTIYPDSLGWGATNPSQHAAFQCMWLQYDHVIPNSRGGASTLDNVVVTCAPCNFGRMETTLEEARLINPLSHPTPRKWQGFESWNGLEGFRLPS